MHPKWKCGQNFFQRNMFAKKSQRSFPLRFFSCFELTVFWTDQTRLIVCPSLCPVIANFRSCFRPKHKCFAAKEYRSELHRNIYFISCSLYLVIVIPFPLSQMVDIEVELLHTWNDNHVQTFQKCPSAMSEFKQKADLSRHKKRRINPKVLLLSEWNIREGNSKET